VQHLRGAHQTSEAAALAASGPRGRASARGHAEPALSRGSALVLGVTFFDHHEVGRVSTAGSRNVVRSISRQAGTRGLEVEEDGRPAAVARQAGASVGNGPRLGLGSRHPGARPARTPTQRIPPARRGQRITGAWRAKEASRPRVTSSRTFFTAPGVGQDRRTKLECEAEEKKQKTRSPLEPGAGARQHAEPSASAASAK